MTTTLQTESLDERERRRFRPGPAPFDLPARAIPTAAGAIDHAPPLPTIELDGVWELAEGGEAAERLAGAWPDAIAARVPGSIHTALVESGRLPDPAFGENAPLAKAFSHQTWWYRRTFDAVPGLDRPTLSFGGVSPGCEVWLNGRLLGIHNGAFGGPDYEIGGLLLPKGNTLVVKVLPAPLGNEWNVWHSTVVFNCSYGWHYVNLPAVGIWRSVRVQGAAAVELRDPFVAAASAADAKAGIVGLRFDAASASPSWSGTLHGTIEPDNFAGEACSFRVDLDAGSAAENGGVHLRLTVPEPRLWWPLGRGGQPLYRLKLSFFPDEGRPDFRQTTFGIRSIEMGPGPEGKDPEKYDWTFIVNGEPLFAKGTGWCTLDATMDFSRERYDHFLRMAAEQHVNLLRAWGGGMPETDDFYDLCDRKGIMVLQEWPTCWGSHDKQPQDALEETVRRNTLRLRNHPSLVMWGGGNEIGSGLESESMDRMGRLSVELDGTRPFHLTDPWGGSTHDHIVWNGWTPVYSFDYYATLDALLLGEYGLASAPNLESVLRYMPADEADVWPPEPGRSFYHHLPAFNTRDEMRILTEFAEAFVPVRSLADFVTGTQLAQATSLRHKMEHARSRWPRETGNIPYKLNDVYPGVSWATVDWYGEPKLAHYFSQDAYAPLTACVLFAKLNSPEEDQTLPVVVLDDRSELDGEWEVRVRVYDPQLRPISDDRFPGSGRTEPVHPVGTVRLKGDAGPDAPLLVVSEIAAQGAVRHRTFYWINFASRQGILARLPATSLALRLSDDGREATVVNTGAVPAVGVELRRDPAAGNGDGPFAAEDNFFWLDPSESRTVRISGGRGAEVRCWNLAERG